MAGATKYSRAGFSAAAWVAMTGAVVVVVALAVAAAVVVVERRGSSETSSSTTSVASSTATTHAASTATTSGPTTTSPTTTEAPTTATTTAVPGPAGDSAGKWVETRVPGLPAGIYDLAVSDQAVAYVKYTAGRPRLFVYLFAVDQTVEIPVGADSAAVGGLDLDGLLLVWQEIKLGPTREVAEARIYSRRLPDGPKRQLVSDPTCGMPRVAGTVVAWTSTSPWPPNPEEMALIRIEAAAVDEAGEPTGAAAELVDGALAYSIGDSVWSYGLSSTHLSWETHEAIGTFDPGTYVMDFETMQPTIVSPEAFAGSLGEDKLVYQEAGQIKLLDLADGEIRLLDTQGLFPSAAPTYAAYFRSTRDSDWQVVARGLTGAYEQVLAASTGEPPWFLPPISTSPHRLAFVVGERARVFVWQPE